MKRKTLLFAVPVLLVGLITFWLIYKNTPPPAESPDDLFPQVFQRLKGTWNKNGSPQKESFEISRDSVVEIQHRQVGQNNDPELPFPTICRFKQIAKKAHIKNCPVDDKNKYCTHEALAQDKKIEIKSEFIFTYTVHGIELIEHPENSPKCPTYIDRQKEKIKARNGLPYSFPFSFIDENNILVFGRDTYTKS